MKSKLTSASVVGFAVWALLAAPVAQATWSDHADLIYDTAYTLDQGEFEVGVFSPLMYGVNDRVQLAMHPILLLVLSPHVGLRWQVTPTGPWTTSMSVEGTWSFLEPVNEEGLVVLDDEACDGCGSPGSLHAWPTVSWHATSNLLLSAGAGPRFDFLDLRHVDTALVTHASAQLMINTENLLMIHGTFDTRPWSTSAITDPVVQFTYARAWGMLHLALGVAVGSFDVVFEQGTIATVSGQPGVLEKTEGDIETWPVFPVIDLFFRL